MTTRREELDIFYGHSVLEKTWRMFWRDRWRIGPVATVIAKNRMRLADGPLYAAPGRE